MRKSVSLMLASAMVLTSVSIASATTVDPVTGSVTDNGKAITGPTAAKQGDKVKTGPNSEAQIVYDDGCVVRVAPNKTVIVSTANICQAGVTVQTVAPATDGLIIGALGVGAVAAVLALKPASP